MSITKLLILLLQLMMITKLSELSGAANQNQYYGVEIGWENTQTIDQEYLQANDEFP